MEKKEKDKTNAFTVIFGILFFICFYGYRILMSRDEWNSHLEMFIVSVVSGIIGLIGANYLYKRMSYSEVKKIGNGKFSFVN